MQISITSIDVPQANKIQRVVDAAVAILNGARTDKEISGSIGHERDGRYYRRVLENLGFARNEDNSSTLTDKGLLLAKNPSLDNPVLLSSVLEQKIYQVLFPFLEVRPEGVTTKEIIAFLKTLKVSGLSASTIERRTSSIMGWIRTMGIVEKRGGKFYLASDLRPKLPVIEILDESQPILPTVGDLSEYQEIKKRTQAARQQVMYWKDLAKLERANAAHARLVNLVAKRIRRAGGIAKSNAYIDLATRLDGDYLFEMKSSTEGNIRSQVRSGISQLYEYRYIQKLPLASLVLVVENPLAGKTSWLRDYLENDRDILLVWDGNQKLFGSRKATSSLPFLGLNI